MVDEVSKWATASRLTNTKEVGVGIELPKDLSYRARACFSCGKMMRSIASLEIM
jgi:hypothetical protein